MYYIISLKHTSKRDKYVTLWGPNNAGYRIFRENSGLYENPEYGYHNDDLNKPIKPIDVHPLFTNIVDEGKMVSVILNTPENIKKILEISASYKDLNPA